MACLRNLGLLILTCVQLLVMSFAQESSKCKSFFKIDNGELGGIDRIVFVSIQIDETAPMDYLYTLEWSECITAPKVTDENFIKYFHVDDTEPCKWVVSLKANLTGVPDYPLHKEMIETTKTFDGFTSPTSCEVKLQHTIIDFNTQTPIPDYYEKTVNIPENFPLDYTLDFETGVHDHDGTPENNRFTVITDDKCPIAPASPIYTSGENRKIVNYYMNQHLDYERLENIACNITFRSDHITVLESSIIINIAVEDIADEPPNFNYDYYYAEVTSTMVTGKPLNVMPERISASDGDVMINSPITYKLIDADLFVGGSSYFQIDKDSGEVTLYNELDTHFLLSFRQVTFFIEASDGSQTSNAALLIELPPAPTTTTTPVPTTTTTPTTCEPCVCTTPTTESTTEPPTPTPCPDVTCPPTPSEGTCLPCPDDTCPPTPSEGTCTPCPDVTCPPTPSEGTCTPCPDVTCPPTPSEGTCTPCTDITCPPTPSEGTCTPCPTGTTTVITCPDVTCPPTPAQCTCDPCSSETTTEFTCPTVTCPDVTCPSTPGTHTTHTPGPTISWGPDQPTLSFEQASYFGEIYSSVNEVYQVKVKDIGYDVIYEWSDESPSREFFDIDPKNGLITVKKDNRPPIGPHQIKAIAYIKVSPSEQATTYVNINVLSFSSDQVMITNSIMKYTTQENKTEEEEVAVLSFSMTPGSVCIIRAQPLNMLEHFKVEKNQNTWVIKKIKILDYETSPEISLLVEAGYDEVTCPTATDNFPPNLLRNQALVMVSVQDVNDKEPVFAIKEATVAYPTNPGLQRAAGPVVRYQAMDEDSENVRYSVTGRDASQFSVDEETGEVYVVKGLECDKECVFGVKATDDKNEDEIHVKVLPLDMAYVFTLLMNNIRISEVDEALTRLSKEVDAQISKVYASPIQQSEALQRTKRQTREEQTSLEVHVYGIKNNSLMSLENMNSILGDASSPLEAEKFKEEEMFEAEIINNEDNTQGLTIAVGVLGALLGLVLIAGIGLFSYKKIKGRESPKQPTPESPINTLTRAYENHSYDRGEKNGMWEDFVDSGEKRRQGSLQGFTSAQVHNSSNEGDSPPLHKSQFAQPSNVIPLRSIGDPYSHQPQGEFGRAEPSQSDYFGPPKSSPPLSFPRPTISPDLSDTPTSPSSSSFPIYAEVKKNKSSKRPTTPPSTSYKNDKAAEPDADYEEVGISSSSKFTSLKASPPPRRSNRHRDDDDDDYDDTDNEVSYSGSEPETSDEKKSVAFKVMVDTKEIEAENMGPSQRKAEVEQRMKENREKMQTEDEDEGEDEDSNETAKL